MQMLLQLISSQGDLKQRTIT